MSPTQRADCAAVQSVGSLIPVEMGCKIPWLGDQWAWAVPEQSLASAGCVQQIYNLSCVISMCCQSRSSCLLCYMQRQVYMRPTSCLKHFGNLCAWMVYLCFWKWAWLTQKHRKSCIPAAFAMTWLCFLGILGICSIVWSPSNHTCPEARSLWAHGLRCSWLLSTLNTTFLQQLSFICRIQSNFMVFGLFHLPFLMLFPRYLCVPVVQWSLCHLILKILVVTIKMSIFIDGFRRNLFSFQLKKEKEINLICFDKNTNNRKFFFESFPEN